jgi:hypothetical protein
MELVEEFRPRARQEAERLWRELVRSQLEQIVGADGVCPDPAEHRDEDPCRELKRCSRCHRCVPVGAFSRSQSCCDRCLDRRREQAAAARQAQGKTPRSRWAESTENGAAREPVEPEPVAPVPEQHPAGMADE